MAPKPLPIFIPSKVSAKKGFPVTEGLGAPPRRQAKTSAFNAVRSHVVWRPKKT